VTYSRILQKTWIPYSAGQMKVNRILHPNIALSIKCSGESITIHSEGIFFPVDYTAGWAWRDACGCSLSLLTLWWRSDLASAFISWVLCHKLGHPAFYLHKKVASSYLFFYGLQLYQVHKCIEGCHWSMGTVFCHSSVCEWMEKFKMVAQALSIRREPDQQLKEAAHSWFVLSA
jgi:hypothetical protein